MTSAQHRFGGEPATYGMVGRRLELARLTARLQHVAAGHGGLVLLAGEPGIGKSSLVDTVTRSAGGHGLQVALGRCQETEGAPPYWPWTQVLAALPTSVPDDGLLAPLLHGASGLDGRSDRFRLFHAATELLVQQAHRRPLLIVLDDLHRADEASLALLRFVVPALRRTPALVLGAYRSTEVPIEHPLSRLLAELAGGAGFELVELSGLSLAETAELAACLPGAEAMDLGALHERTAGNPFFLTELLRLGPHSGAGVSRTVDAAIRERVRRLPAFTQELLTLAAVLGRDVDGPLLAALAGRPARQVLEGLAPAVSAGLLTEDPAGAGHRFVHILVQHALHATHSAMARAQLHDRAVVTMQRPSPDGASGGSRAGGGPARLAWHAVRAAVVPGGRERAVELGCRAARAATARLADEEAADWYARVLELEPAGEEATADLLLELGRSAGRAGRETAAREAFERAWALGAAHSWTERLVAAALGLGEVVVSAGRVDAGLVRLLERTLDRLGPGDEGSRISVSARLATELYWGPELPRARALATGAVVAARADGDPRVLAAALAAEQFVLRGPSGVQQRLEIGAELTELAVSLGDAESELRARRMLVPDLMQCDPVRATAELASLADLATSSGRPLAEWYVLVLRAMRATMSGEPDAVALVDQADALGQRIRAQPAAIYACGQRFTLRHHLDLADVEAEVRRLAARYPVLSVFRCQLAVLLAETGRHEEAAALLDELTAGGCTALPPDSLWLGNIAMLAEVATALEDSPRAEDLHHRLTPYAGRVVVGGVPMWNGAVDRYLALTSTALEKWEQADAAFSSALRLHHTWGARPLVARTLAEHASMLRRRGAPSDRRRAAALMRQAAAVGPASPARTGAAEPAPQRMPTRPGLTEREAEVLALLADGSSNKAIASRLRLSVHTVERHLANLYVKIGARNRVDAAAYALRPPVRPGAPGA